MSVVGVIPVRFGATRFPGKPLASILGKPMLQWVLEGVSQSRKINKIIVATDHEGIAQVATQLGYAVKMTPSELPSGSDRVWWAVKDEPCDVVVNIQGDEPLILGEVLDQLVSQTEQPEQKEVMMWTLGHELSEETLHSQQVAKVVINKDREAMYFSRLAIPFSRRPFKEFASLGTTPCLKHIGIYAFRKNFLKTFCEQSPIGVEEAEGLEQLRALYLKARLRVVEVKHDCWGVDIPSDVKKIEALLQQRQRR